MRKSYHDPSNRGNPSDEANAAAEGLFLCLLHGDWANGLPLLARSPEPKLKAAASCETLDPSAPAEELAAGDAWLLVSKGGTPAIKNASQDRAVYRYSRAVRDSSGIEKQAAIRKLESVPGQMLFSAIAAGHTVKTNKVATVPTASSSFL